MSMVPDVKPAAFEISIGISMVWPTSPSPEPIVITELPSADTLNTNALPTIKLAIATINKTS
jgi:hypothetical protein